MIRAAVIPRPNVAVEMRELPEPDLEPGAALLKTELCEVCGTDVHLQQGRLAETPYPLIPGHAAVGTLEKIRGEVADHDGRPFSEGERVTFLDVHATCGRCYFCSVAKASTRCPHRKVYGITYGLEDGIMGGWSEKVHLRPGVRIARLPRGVTPEALMGGGCGLFTALHAVDRADIRLAQSVLVQGTGPVGLSCVALARLSGAGAIIAIGAPEERLRAARRMGADLTLDVETTSPDERREAVLGMTEGRGVDTGIEASGAPVAVPEGMRLTRDNGVYVLVGQYTDHGSVEINPHLDVNKKHLDVRGVWGIDFSHVYRALRILQRENPRYHWERTITGRYTLDQANDALCTIAERRHVKAVITPTV
jgi:L-iditol 2-dehydrogenase